MCNTDKKYVAYEQAVKAYQFQVTRYNTWMNYYALFVGALFVGFYWIICNSSKDNPDAQCLLILISLLGIAASICWMASLIGNCAWMNNYIKIVKDRENEFLGQTSYVYQYIRTETSCIADLLDGRWRPGFISTQKVTQWFVGAVLAAWIYIFICLKYGNIIIWRCDNIGISIIAALVIWVIFKCIPFSLWSDNLKGMKPKE